VSVLAKYASHLDVRLGELESEQRLQQIRTDRFIKGTIIAALSLMMYSFLASST
jgi:hypothetical protein